MGRHRVVGNVAEIVTRKLSEGQWAPPATFPSVREMAALCGVSAKTMMAALKELADRGLLRIEQRKRIEVAEGAAELARDILQPRVDDEPVRHRMAILFPESYMPPGRNAAYSILLRVVANEAGNWATDIEVVPWTVQNQLAVANSLVHRGFDRALIFGYHAMYLAAIHEMHERGFAFMIFNQRVPGLPRPSVVYDAHTASHRMAQRLAALGHRNMCLVGHPHDYPSEVETDLPINRGKVSGWLDFLSESGLLETCAMPLYMPWEPVLGLYSRTFREMMSSPERPTAILFSHSPWAKVFLNDPELSRFVVPRDLSLATFETTEGLPHPSSCPTLTNIEINYVRTAQCVMETLDKIAAGSKDVPIIRVPLDSHITESIGPAPVVEERSHQVTT